MILRGQTFYAETVQALKFRSLAARLGRARREGFTPRHGPALGVTFALGLALASAACNLLSPSSSSSSTTSSTTTTETFAGALALRGSNLYTFTVVQAGAVGITLSSLSPTAVAVGLALGTPNGTTACTITSSNPAAVAGSTPQITVTENPGTYCVEIYDVGNLTSASTFIILITHS